MRPISGSPHNLPRQGSPRKGTGLGPETVGSRRGGSPSPVWRSPCCALCKGQRLCLECVSSAGILISLGWCGRDQHLHPRGSLLACSWHEKPRVTSGHTPLRATAPPAPPACPGAQTLTRQNPGRQGPQMGPGAWGSWAQAQNRAATGPASRASRSASPSRAFPPGPRGQTSCFWALGGLRGSRAGRVAPERSGDPSQAGARATLGGAAPR